jgi:isopentenyldiphosphate isomerase
MPQELFDILNPDGTSAGRTATREEAHAQGLWHRTVHIWITDGHGSWLFQKRSLTKDIFPGLWDVSCAGHISAGESPEAAAKRELAEELGITAPPPLKWLLTVPEEHQIRPDFTDREYHEVYLLVIDKNSQFKFTDGEVTEAKWFQKPPENCAPHKYLPSIM